MLDFSIYLLYRAASFVVVLIPLRLLFHIGELLGLLAWFFLGSYRRLARRNLAIAFGDGEITGRIATAGSSSFPTSRGQLALQRQNERDARGGSRGVGASRKCDLVHEEVRAGHPVVLVLSHLSNWEIFAPLLPLHFGQVRHSTLYQKLRNPYIDADVQRKRARSGVELFDRSEGFRGADRAPARSWRHRNSERSTRGRSRDLDSVFWPACFHLPTRRIAGQENGSHRHAVRPFLLKAPLVGAWSLLLAWMRPGDSVEAITAKANRVMEDQIRRAPEDWFWVHNRWKTPQPNFLLAGYKRGVYLPRQIPRAALQPFRILIRGTNWLGDSVISAAAVRAIKHGRPDARVSVAAPARLAAVWKLIPEVDEVIALPAGSLFADRAAPETPAPVRRRGPVP